MRELSPEELEELRVFMRTTRDVRLLKRAQIVWMKSQGKSVPEIARDLDVDEDTVREWLRRYEESGLEGLRDRPRSGRPAVVTGLYVQTLLDWVPKSPRLAGIQSHNWTLGLLAGHMERLTGIRISEERVRQLLLAHRIRFTRPKLHLVSPDPDYDAKVEEIRVVIATAGPDTAVLFEDEADLHLNPFIRGAWQGERGRVRAAGKNQKRFAFGAVDIRTGDVHQRVCRRKRGVEFVAFLRQLRRAYLRKKILLVLDNFGIHDTKRVRAYVAEQGDRLRILWLPTYSPQLNPIEPFWKYEKGHVLANVFHESVDAMVKSVKGWYRAYREGRVRPFQFALPQKFQGLC